MIRGGRYAAQGACHSGQDYPIPASNGCFMHERIAWAGIDQDGRMDSGLQNWLGAAGAIIATVLIQLAARLLLVRMLARHNRHRAVEERLTDLWPAAKMSLVTVFVLLFGHLLQVLVWALLYLGLGELGDQANAVYFSLASYTTVGAVDLELSRAHRVLGALEAGVGTLMFAWSAAILVTLVGLQYERVEPTPPARR